MFFDFCEHIVVEAFARHGDFRVAHRRLREITGLERCPSAWPGEIVGGDPDRETWGGQGQPTSWLEWAPEDGHEHVAVPAHGSCERGTVRTQLVRDRYMRSTSQDWLRPGKPSPRKPRGRWSRWC